MKIWKKNLVAAAILVTVCGGIYLNWLYTEDQATMDLTSTLNSEKLLSPDLLVMAGQENLEPEENTMTDYFAAVRLSRQEARDEALTLIQEAMSYDTDTGTSAAQLEQIVQTALTEAQIESLIIAKGYTDCVAYISEKGISVAVAAPEGGLQERDVAVIADIVMSQSEFNLSQIFVIEVQ
jgi:stage III sporulation protein AH